MPFFLHFLIAEISQELEPIKLISRDSQWQAAGDQKWTLSSIFSYTVKWLVIVCNERLVNDLWGFLYLTHVLSALLHQIKRKAETKNTPVTFWREFGNKKTVTAYNEQKGMLVRTTNKVLLHQTSMWHFIIGSFHLLVANEATIQLEFSALSLEETRRLWSPEQLLPHKPGPAGQTLNLENRCFLNNCDVQKWFFFFFLLISDILILSNSYIPIPISTDSDIFSWIGTLQLIWCLAGCIENEKCKNFKVFQIKINVLAQIKKTSSLQFN